VTELQLKGFAVSVNDAYLGLALPSAWLNSVRSQDQCTHHCYVLGENMKIISMLPFLKVVNTYRQQNEENRSVLISVWPAVDQMTLRLLFLQY